MNFINFVFFFFNLLFSSHSADAMSINDIATNVLKGLKAGENRKLEVFSFFAFSKYFKNMVLIIYKYKINSAPQDPCFSTLAEIIHFSPKIRELSVHLRQITKSCNFQKFEDSLTLSFLSSLHSFKLGLASTVEPYFDDASVARLLYKINKGLAYNFVLNSLSIYLLSWGEVEKGFFSLQDLIRDRRITMDVYFYG